MANLTLDDMAEFTWSFHNTFFLETVKGNFVWSDPDFILGDNTIRPFNGTYVDWCRYEGIPFGRNKGKHIIRYYCGNNVVIKKEILSGRIRSDRLF